MNSHDRLKSTDFHSFVAFTTAKFSFKNWTISLPSALLLG
ncbi:hypothetical protein GM3709_1073 [Geminocystis sp. NIES-3709]|nr:hypothetical protein GM3709_1073 [Geminocystis sp. NIES-3709]